MNLSELNCVYDNNPNIMNDELIKKINQTAEKSLKNIKSFNKNQKKHKSWWHKDIQKNVKNTIES